MNQTFAFGRRLMIPAVIAAVVLLVDQLTKAWILRLWPQPYTGELAIIKDWLELTYIRNTGVAFGLFGGMPQLFTVTSLVIVVVAIRFYLKHVPEDHGWLALSLGLIVGGAIGNVIDRVRFGYVVDFIKTFDGRFPIFNVADSCIVVGVFVMAIFLAQSEDRSHPARVAPTIEAEDGR
jgi:signal peptidase II